MVVIRYAPGFKLLLIVGFGKGSDALIAKIIDMAVHGFGLVGLRGGEIHHLLVHVILPGERTGDHRA